MASAVQASPSWTVLGALRKKAEDSTFSSLYSTKGRHEIADPVPARTLDALKDLARNGNDDATEVLMQYTCHVQPETRKAAAAALVELFPRNPRGIGEMAGKFGALYELNEAALKRRQADPNTKPETALDNFPGIAFVSFICVAGEMKNGNTGKHYEDALNRLVKLRGKTKDALVGDVREFLNINKIPAWAGWQPEEVSNHEAPKADAPSFVPDNRQRAVTIQENNLSPVRRDAILAEISTQANEPPSQTQDQDGMQRKASSEDPAPVANEGQGSVSKGDPERAVSTPSQEPAEKQITERPDVEAKSNATSSTKPAVTTEDDVDPPGNGQEPAASSEDPLTSQEEPPPSQASSASANKEIELETGQGGPGAIPPSRSEEKQELTPDQKAKQEAAKILEPLPHLVSRAKLGHEDEIREILKKFACHQNPLVREKGLDAVFELLKRDHQQVGRIASDVMNRLGGNFKLNPQGLISNQTRPFLESAYVVACIASRYDASHEKKAAGEHRRANAVLETVRHMNHPYFLDERDREGRVVGYGRAITTEELGAYANSLPKEPVKLGPVVTFSSQGLAHIAAEARALVNAGQHVVIPVHYVDHYVSVVVGNGEVSVLDSQPIEKVYSFSEVTAVTPEEIEEQKRKYQKPSLGEAVKDALEAELKETKIKVSCVAKENLQGSANKKEKAAMYNGCGLFGGELVKWLLEIKPDETFQKLNLEEKVKEFVKAFKEKTEDEKEAMSTVRRLDMLRRYIEAFMAASDSDETAPIAKTPG